MKEIKFILLLAISFLFVCSCKTNNNDDTIIPPSPSKPSYVIPGATEVVNTVKTLHPQNAHPRLMITKSDVQLLKTRVANDATYKSWYTNVKANADKLLITPVVTSLERHTLLQRMMELGIVYQIEGDSKYADRAWKELEKYSSLSWTNPKKDLLDIGYISKGYAIGYDWCYDAFTPAQRTQLETQIKNNVLTPMASAYINPASVTTYNGMGKIAVSDNWNPSCNGGAIMAALAMCDGADMANLSGNVISGGMKNYQIFLNSFSPEGTCAEGIYYWTFGIESTAEFLESLRTATGKTYGYADVPGLSETAYYVMYNTGPKGIFDFGNASSYSRITSPFYALANIYKDSKIGSYRTQYMKSNGLKGDVYDLIWYKSEYGSDVNVFSKLPFDRKFSGKEIETISMRSDWTGNGLYAAIKCGYNCTAHGQLNSGTFVIDALGQRWVRQLGSNSYGPGYFSGETQRDGVAFTYYKKRAESQNTLVINPDILADQIPTATTKIESYDITNRSVLLDLTTAYSHAASKVKRKMEMVNKEKIVLTDDIICNNNSTIYWFVHTDAIIAIAADGRSATFTKGGKTMNITLESSNSSAKFSEMAEAPLPTSPVNSNNDVISSTIKKLTIKVENAKALDLKVSFIPQQ